MQQPGRHRLIGPTFACLVFFFNLFLLLFLFRLIYEEIYNYYKADYFRLLYTAQHADILVTIWLLFVHSCAAHEGHHTFRMELISAIFQLTK